MTIQTLNFTREDTLTPITATLCKLTELPKNPDINLHPKEAALKETFKSPKRQTEYTLGRLAAKQALRELYPDIPSNKIHIAKSIPGYPVIEHPQIQNKSLSISHSSGTAVALVSPETHPVAIDIETIDPKRAHVIESILCPDEFNLLSKDPEERVIQLFTLWSAKEALTKQLRTGFTIPKTILEISTLSPKITFKNFPIFQATSQTQKNQIITLIHPKNSTFLLQ